MVRVFRVGWKAVIIRLCRAKALGYNYPGCRYIEENQTGMIKNSIQSLQGTIRDKYVLSVAQGFSPV